MDISAEKPAASMPLSEAAEMVRILLDHPFLQGLSAGHLQVLAASAMLKTFEPGEVIFRLGDMANRFYLIRTGKVALEWREPDREPMLIQNIGAGDVVGWSWLFPPYEWLFDARALERTETIFLYATRLREQCEEDTTLGYELMKRLAAIAISRLQATRRQLLQLRKPEN